MDVAALVGGMVEVGWDVCSGGAAVFVDFSSGPCPHELQNRIITIDKIDIII